MSPKEMKQLLARLEQFWVTGESTWANGLEMQTDIIRLLRAQDVELDVLREEVENLEIENQNWEDDIKIQGDSYINSLKPLEQDLKVALETLRYTLSYFEVIEVQTVNFTCEHEIGVCSCAERKQYYKLLNTINQIEKKT